MKFGFDNKTEVPPPDEQEAGQSSNSSERTEVRGTREIFLGKQVDDPVSISYTDDSSGVVQITGSVKAINKNGKVWEFTNQELQISGGGASFSKTSIEGLDNITEPAIVVETLTEGGKPEFKMLLLTEISSIS